MQRVQKLMSSICSRRKAEEYIKAGRVKVNDEVITLGDKAGPDDVITMDGNVIEPEKKVYIIFNKPRGCVTAMTDAHEKTVMEYIDVKERVFPVGRLDKDTTGLLILTNDGTFANKIMHPSNEIKKTYVAKINGHISKGDLTKLEQGVELEDGKTAPAQVKQINPSELELTIHEGKNRIVRRMLEHVGFEIKSLSRIKVGELVLGDIKLGEYELVDKPEI